METFADGSRRLDLTTNKPVRSHVSDLDLGLNLELALIFFFFHSSLFSIPYSTYLLPNTSYTIDFVPE